MTAAIRPATPADIPMVLEMWRAAGAAPSVTDTAPDLERVVTAPHAEVLLAVDDDGAVVGSLIATFDGWRGNFYRLAVATDHRRRGIARRLVEAGEAWLRAAGASKLSALVEGDRAVAQALWATVGFEHYEGMRRYSKIL